MVHTAYGPYMHSVKMYDMLEALVLAACLLFRTRDKRTQRVLSVRSFDSPVCVCTRRSNDARHRLASDTRKTYTRCGWPRWRAHQKEIFMAAFMRLTWRARLRCARSVWVIVRMSFSRGSLKKMIGGAAKKTSRRWIMFARVIYCCHVLSRSNDVGFLVFRLSNLKYYTLKSNRYVDWKDSRSGVLCPSPFFVSTGKASVSLF